MHTYCASNGLAQHALNGLVLARQAQGVQLTTIDAWVARIKSPGRFHKLTRCFFEKRVDQNPDKAMHAYASEVLTAISYLKFFIDTCVREHADGDLLAHIYCFDWLWIITNILQRGERERGIPLLRTAIREFHGLYVQLYHKIPKLHNQPHVADAWEFWEAVLSCWGPERHHKIFKRVGLFSYRRIDKTALATDVRQWAHSLDNPCLFMPAHLAGTVVQTNVHCDWPDSTNRINFVSAAPSMTNPQSSLDKKDLIQYQDGSADGIGFAVSFLQSVGDTFAVLLQPCVLSPDGWRRTDRMLVVAASLCITSVPYFEEGIYIRPSLERPI